MEMIILNEHEYQMFIDKIGNASFYQSVAYGLTMKNQGFEPIFIGLKNKTKIVAGALILIKKLFGFKYGYCPRGFVIDYNNFELVKIWTKELKKLMNHHNLIAVKLCPLIEKGNPNYFTIFNHLKELDYYHCGYNNYFEALKPRFESYVDLEPSIDLLFKNVKKEFKTKIRTATKHGIKIIKGEKEDIITLHNQTKRKYSRDLKYFNDLYSFFSKTNQIDIFYAKFDTRQYLEKAKGDYEINDQESEMINQLVLENNKKNYNIISKKLIIDQKFSQSKKNLIFATKISTHHPHGINIASALVITHKDEAYLLLDGLNEKYKSLNAKHLLIWHLIDYYKKNNYRRLNLGGIIDPSIKDHKFTGLNQFKQSFNANNIEYIGDLEIVINKPKYFLFSRVKPISKILKR